VAARLETMGLPARCDSKFTLLLHDPRIARMYRRIIGQCRYPLQNSLQIEAIVGKTATSFPSHPATTQRSQVPGPRRRRRPTALGVCRARCPSN
jgi:hypothetical protein